jgi:fibronectin type 3 domain-containing protein
MKTRFFLLLFFHCIFANIQADKGVKLLIHPCERDSILLRWAPTDKETWDLGNLYGYVVERYTILRNGQLPEDRDFRRLTPEAQKPASLQEWQLYEDNRYVSIAAECIFSETESLPLPSPVAIGKRYQEEQNRFSFALYAADQSVLTARLSGLYFADKTALPDEKYLYSVHIPAPDTIARLDTAFVFTGLSEYRELPKPIDLNARWEDKKVLLSWNILYLNHIYNSYIVEKSTDGKHYFPISENAVVQAADEGVNPEYAYRSDSLPDNRTVWYYRIRGVNAFGETGQPSEPVEGRGHIPITTAPTIIEKEVLDNQHIRLTWSYPDEMNEYISGFRLYRSDKPGGTKEKIYESKKTEERSFTDLSPNLTNYYILSVYDRETEKFTLSHTYAELIDSIPPAPPTDLAGTIDSTGVIRLAWKSNLEKDIDGYRVYRSNRPDFEFLLITPSIITDNSFTDSVQLQTLNKEIYYRLRAIDLRQNQSEFGDILGLKRPDVIPPVAPVIQSVEAQKNSLLITWLNSSSTDVVRHHVYCQKEGSNYFRRMASLDKPTGRQSVYLDGNVQAGKTYSYQVRAEDDSGLLSEASSPMQQKAPGEIAGEIVLKTQTSFGQIRIAWEIKSKKKVERVLIYKAVGDDPMSLYSNSTESSFTDIETAAEKTVAYCIKAIYDDGSSSGLSNEAVVKM